MYTWTAKWIADFNQSKSIPSNHQTDDQVSNEEHHQRRSVSSRHFDAAFDAGRRGSKAALSQSTAKCSAKDLRSDLNKVANFEVLL